MNHSMYNLFEQRIQISVLPISCCQIGTDIEDFKCSWLVVKALECCNEEQKKILYVS